jgi:hypothetical protein
MVLVLSVFCCLSQLRVCWFAEDDDVEVVVLLGVGVVDTEEEGDEG